MKANIHELSLPVRHSLLENDIQPSLPAYLNSTDPIEHLIITAHGHPSHIEISEKPFDRTITGEDFAVYLHDRLQSKLPQLSLIHI